MRIDGWTLALQTINLLVLIWILRRFLLRPVLAMMARRQAQLQQVQLETSAMKEQAAQILADLQAQREHIQAERDQILADARTQAQANSQALAAQAEQALHQRELDAQASQAQQAQALAEALKTRVASLAGTMAGKLLAPLPAVPLQAFFMARLCQHIETLPAQQAQQLTQDLAPRPDGSPAALELACPWSLNDDTLAPLRAVLAQRQSAGAPAPRITVVPAPELLAGFELRLQHLLLCVHWAADLNALQETLHDDTLLAPAD